MKQTFDKYSGTAVIFLTAAVMFVATPLIFGIGDFATAAFVVAGMTCTIMGSFVVMYAGNDPVDTRLVGLLPVQGCLNLCRIASDTGVTGRAYFLPPRFTGHQKIMQFNPVSHYKGEVIATSGGSVTVREPHGMVTVPSSAPLIEDLRKKNAVVIPEKIEDLGVLLSEVITETFEFAAKVTTTVENGRVTVTMHDYRFIEGCEVARASSPACCNRFPCPSCSMCGTFVAEITGKPVVLDGCSVASPKNITAAFSCIP